MRRIKKTGCLVVVFLLMASLSEAAQIEFPQKNPTLSVYIPDAWESEVSEYGTLSAYGCNNEALDIYHGCSFHLSENKKPLQLKTYLSQIIEIFEETPDDEYESIAWETPIECSTSNGVDYCQRTALVTITPDMGGHLEYLTIRVFNVGKRQFNVDVTSHWLLPNDEGRGRVQHIINRIKPVKK